MTIVEVTIPEFVLGIGIFCQNSFWSIFVVRIR